LAFSIEVELIEVLKSLYTVLNGIEIVYFGRWMLLGDKKQRGRVVKWM
jgi:hypothetical protein